LCHWATQLTDEIAATIMHSFLVQLQAATSNQHIVVRYVALINGQFSNVAAAAVINDVSRWRQSANRLAEETDL